MDQLLFDQHLQNSTVIEEATTCFETFIYTVGELCGDPDRVHVTEESTLEHHEFDDFIHQTGRFKKIDENCRGGIRLM
ncbi:magnesium transport transmembrane region protein [Rutstroemia sp. NJR-2017a WRK4]|nr:magnesium transport transmembrane region protein [Rutstroemia sp. NJR-2017a WRK4]